MLTLLLFQGVLVGLGALPLFWLVAGRSGEPRLGLLVALSYLLHPAILFLAFNDYRTIVLGLPLALLALWFHATRRPLWFVASSVLMLSARDDYALLLPFFGLINWRLTGARGRSLRWILAPVLIALLWVGLTDAYYLAGYGRSWPVLGYAVAGPRSSTRRIRSQRRWCWPKRFLTRAACFVIGSPCPLSRHSSGITAVCRRLSRYSTRACGRVPSGSAAG